MRLQFIEPEIIDLNYKEPQPASYVRRVFETAPDKTVARAVLTATALGVYIPYVNGQQCSDELLLPGFTDYNRRLQYQVMDVTDLIVPGENIFMAEIGDGWYRGNLGAFNKRNCYGDKLKFAASIEITYTDHSQAVIETDECWEASQNGPLGRNDLKIAEHYDARLEAFMEWHPCKLSEYHGELVAMEGEPLLEHERFTPKVLRTPDGNTVLDFAQNLAGHVAFTVTGPAGHRVELIMGETLDDHGNFTLKNLQGDDKETGPMRLGQHLYYTLKEGKQSYRSHFLVSGYRYALVINWPEEVRAENFTSIAIYSNLKSTGTFSCSNPLVNQLVDCVKWCQKSNFVDIPTDCPQRERAGWTGDINVFLETANYLTDTRKFMRKWMRDFVGTQKADGALPHIVPPVPAIGTGQSSAGWADAIAAIPLGMYQFYGEKEDLEVAYAAAKKFVDYNVRRAQKKHFLHLLNTGKHQRYILDTGFHFGEWLEPEGSNMKDALKAMICPDAETATAWFFYSAENVERMARILGKRDDAEKYHCLKNQIRQAYRKEFLKDGKVISRRQCKYVRPIYMGLATSEEIKGLAAALNDLCVANDYKIGTGFLTTYQILQVLTDCGYAETAYKMLENEACPGWLYPIKCGATTTWEGWNAIDPNTHALKPLSQNHYASGAAVAWLFSHCAGIRPKAPGFAKVEIRPVPGGSLTRASASYESIHGAITVSWRRDGAEFKLDVKFPDAVKARIVLPDGTMIQNAKSGCYSCKL